MVGFDTNVLVRYLAQDDAAQSRLANRAFGALSKDEPGFISLIVLCEMVWVLEDLYAMKKPALIDILRTLLESDELQIESKALVWQVFGQFSGASLDFSDALIAAVGSSAGGVHTLTFDKAAAKAAGLSLLKS